ncbi:MAG: VOC family protein [Actinomycetota bacterium]
MIQISSHRPLELKAFYSDVVGLEIDENVGGFKVGSGFIVIDSHDDVSGPNDQPARFLVNLFVDDIASEQARLVAAGVPMIRDRGKEFWGATISTFIDPDGNYFQLIEFRP